MTSEAPVWESDAEDQTQVSSSPVTHTEIAKTGSSQFTAKKTFNAKVPPPSLQVREREKIEKQIEKDEQNQQSQQWQTQKKNIQKTMDEKPYKQQKITYDKFVKDLPQGPSSSKDQTSNLSNNIIWEPSNNVDDGPRGFKKADIVGQANGITENNGERPFGGFKRFGTENDDNKSNGESIGFGGRGTRSVGGGDKEGGLGGGGGRGFSGFGGDSGGRGTNRNFGEQRNGGRFGGGGFQGGFQDRGGRGGRGRGGRGGFGGGFGRRDFGEGGFGGGGGFRRDFNSQRTGFQTPQNVISEVEQPKETFNIAELSIIEGIPKPNTQQKISQQFRINSTMATQPFGLKCWPSVSIYIRKSKLSFYLSRIHDHNCSILYFPYSNFTMDLYPGNMVNQFPFDYRKKLKEKDKPTGESYMQRCVGVKNFQVVAFARINLQDLQTTPQSIDNLFEQANRSEKQQLESALIPYSSQLGSLQPILQVCFDVLSKYDKFKEIIISTNCAKTFCKAAGQFLNAIQVLADNNDLVIQ